MIQGQPFTQTWLFRDKATGQSVNMAGWTGQVSFACGQAIEPLPLSILPSGRIMLNLTAEQVDDLGHGTYQINLNAPSPDFNEVWQGTVFVAEAV
ncbi:hypothetical protein BVG79_01098 [Ketogulonicigenium robustum]|uniref:Uncharacterized protein n=2 Tax=Ketogulonicigenium robustum TaxID=92947 RepID=A0A1W6NZ01_9RHOB|nr:hypothetical protein BVG79_01098 [Ketogulonicigenium robustum]